MRSVATARCQPFSPSVAVVADVARRERQWWRVSWSGHDDTGRAAQAIVTRLRREPGTVDAVRELLKGES